MAPDERQSAEYVAVERAALRTLLDWYDEPEHDTWGSDVPAAAQRLRLQLSKGVDPDAPDPIDLVHQLRQALGWPNVALPCTPKQAWEAAIEGVRQLRHRNELLVRLSGTQDG